MNSFDRWPARTVKQREVREQAVNLLLMIDEDIALPHVVRLEARRLAHIIKTGGFSFGFWLAVDNTHPKEGS